LAYLAWLRCRELVDAGKGSMLPDAPRGEALKSLMPRPDFVKADVLLDPAFLKLRAEADAWHAARTVFMTRRLKEGRHPDTDPISGQGYTAPPAPGLPPMSVPAAYTAGLTSRNRMMLAVIIGVPVLSVGLIVGLSAARSAKARRQTHQANGTSASF